MPSSVDWIGLDWIGLDWVLAAGYVGFRWYMRRVVQRCLALQLAALREYQPDVVVGKSFVCVELY